MSNATTLQTNNNKLSANNTDLATILNTINNLPEAGSGGGSSTPDTCTISIDLSNASAKYIVNYCFVVYKNGQYTIEAMVGDYENYSKSTLTVNDVVCGSSFRFSYNYPIEVTNYSWETNNITDFTFTNTKCVGSGKAPTTAGVTGTIIIKSLGGGYDGPPEL